MSRFTRSRTIPEWSFQEMLALVVEIAAVDNECGTSFSSHQKWAMVSDHLAAQDVRRNSLQCRRKWDELLSEYRGIKDSESPPKGDGRTGTGPPQSFDRDLFGLIDNVITSRKKGKGGCGGGSGGRGARGGDVVLVEEKKKVEAEALDFSGSHESEVDEARNILERLQEKATYLEEFAEQIEAILRGDLSEDTRITCTLADLKKPNAMETAFKRQQVDELIKMFGNLTSILDQLK